MKLIKFKTYIKIKNRNGLMCSKTCEIEIEIAEKRDPHRSGRHLGWLGPVPSVFIYLCTQKTLKTTSKKSGKVPKSWNPNFEKVQKSWKMFKKVQKS